MSILFGSGIIAWVSCTRKEERTCEYHPDGLLCTDHTTFFRASGAYIPPLVLSFLLNVLHRESMQARLDVTAGERYLALCFVLATCSCKTLPSRPLPLD